MNNWDVVPLKHPEDTGVVPAEPLTDTPPSWLSDEGQLLWPGLVRLHEPTVKDAPEFACFVEAVAEFQIATGIVQTDGFTTYDAEGTPIANPALAVRDKADGKVFKWAGRFK